MNKVKMKFELKPVLYFLVGLIFGMALVFPYDKSSATIENKLIKLTYSEYETIRSKEDTSVIMVGRDSCGWCEKFIPILSEIVKNKNIKIYYLDTDSLTKEEKDRLNESDSLFTSEEFGTPTLLMVQNNKIINYNVGYMESNETTNWLIDVGIINEK